MKRNYFILLFAALFFSGIYSCNPAYKAGTVQYHNYRITNTAQQTQQSDTVYNSFLGLYRDSVSRVMDKVINSATKTLTKKRPESELGNFLADALLYMAEEKYKTKVDVAFINYGGIRLEQLPAGDVTIGKVFEIMPFDNLLILQKLKGSVLQEFLDLTAKHGGWPVSGITMQIKNGKAVNIKVGDKPLDAEATYTISNSDYIANGGDNADMLKALPQISNGYLMRDAIADYIIKLKKEGKQITADIENRVINAE